MTKLGIIGAMQVEVEILLGAMENKKEVKKAGSTFYEGTLNGQLLFSAAWARSMPPSALRSSATCSR